MNKLLVICGPTGVGKTSLALRLAKKFSGEIVSADSRQVYKGMDVGTGKEIQSGKWRQLDTEWVKRITESTERKLKAQRFGYWEVGGIPILMLDVVRPNQEFSVAQYVELAWKVILDIWERKKLPIIVGGTGFYIKGLIDGIETLGVPPDWELRKILGYYDIKRLSEELKKLDSARWERMNKSDRKNPRRLIRAIEIANAKTQKIAKMHKDMDALFIGLKAPYRELYRRIDKRIDEQVKIGAEKEVKKLLEQGYTWDLPAMTAMGYGVWRPYLEKSKIKNQKSKILKEIIQRWKYQEHAYSRRQMTWFKRDRRINWFNINETSWKEKVEDLVRVWYNENIKNQNAKS